METAPAAERVLPHPRPEVVDPPPVPASSVQVMSSSEPEMRVCPACQDPTAALVITRAPPEAARPPVNDMGYGGVKHKYLKNLVKVLGKERGFRVGLEVPVYDGSGRVDAVLVRAEMSIAFEISVTTTKDHELGNVEKCLSLPYTHVAMLGSHVRRRASLERFIAGSLDEGDKKRVSFLLPEDLPSFLGRSGASSLSSSLAIVAACGSSAP